MKHTNAEHAAIAERATVLRTQVGSGVHGLAIEGTDDRDEMGLCVEPPESVIGLRPFEQYVFRTAAERTGDPDARSRPGDLDLVVYSLRKWMRLALQGNPTVITPLFAPDHDVVVNTDLGRELRADPGMVISREAGKRFIGYLRGQRERMVGGAVGKRVNRPELVERHGFDVKFAGHMVRLGVQGVELLETGRITLPMPDPWRTFVRDLRQGRRTAQEAIDAAAELEARLLALLGSSDLPPRPDTARANAWLVNAYESTWAGWRDAA
ncbi:MULTISPECIES: DNA polymerase beta superfamily protein [Actinosynnema]|uniref:nucleotidyltransferase domain-containing protein n=1 Tax=Actinosynnema TaxID=40566 RepID=UPI0020A5CA57|nr:nucleotidyltransferase domain-containing protein [Actinosynnema pretiosum]MCP2099440.1 putative nucleotidyltransferase [Actinosynnema pretiosum]